ncbi:hypothetical protein F4678DRAFT_56520 [Xylaria arbuscula]|nr:hypothetical protein F4678DRAFT_56520 [Xylaria arbuscula]
MDQPSAPSPTGTSQPAKSGAAVETLRDRRREKPLLSCTFCRSRKVRCNRQLPCKTCLDRGIGLSCTYRSTGSRQSNISVGDRIQQLESLVRSLVASPQQQTQHTPPGPFPDSSPYQGAAFSALDDLAPASAPDHASPAAAGTMRRSSNGANYVSSVHWAAVLDSISELKDHYEEEEEARLLVFSEYAIRQSPGPRLLYEPVQATQADILALVPPRPVVDRMVARYFNAQGVVPDTLHTGQFLKEYDTFWLDPSAASLIWVGLLFSVMCLSTLYQHSIEEPTDPETLLRVDTFREQTVNCLILGQYTRGKDYTLETMINYLTCEMFLTQDAESGLWLVQGMIVQLALSLGYHRDANNFPNLSPFVGEMRRRVWASIVQIDLRLSGQMALPRLLKLQQYDTAEPCNLLDSDFDENTVQLPPSRPETEVTPVLYSLAKGRIDKMNGLISDLINNTNEPRYSEITELDQKLQAAEASLPPTFRWQPLHQSFMVQPQIVMHRVLLQLAIQRLVVWIHRKYLAPPYTDASYRYSQNACVQAAVKIVEFQQIIDDETQQDGLMYPVRWMFKTSRLQAVFLLGISILCYYLELIKTCPALSLHPDKDASIHLLLRNTYPLWVRLSIVSQGARRAVEHLRLQLGLRDNQDGNITLATTPGNTFEATVTSQANTTFLEAFNLGLSEDYLSTFPTTIDFGVEMLGANTPI